MNKLSGFVWRLSRRRFLALGASAVVATGLSLQSRLGLASGEAPRLRPVHLSDVTLKPSICRDSVAQNRRYLMSLRPDRLLHNFRAQAGLKPKGEVYGGWESETIAGHTLGHYLSALSKQYGQTGAGDCRRRVAYIVQELALCQDQADDGYVGGLTRRNEAGEIEPGRRVFELMRRGQIEASKFELNGSWSPLYTVHKLLAGLLDAQRYCQNEQALPVAVGLAGYIQQAFAPLDKAQTQKVLSCEFGGLNESYAELFHRCGDRRWRLMALKLHHHVVIDPLETRNDDLPGLHANTQIPKIIGLAREYEVSGGAELATASRFFWQRVTGHYSYAIGGNGDREYFKKPDTITDFLTEQTCEHCASYNMLKLTRHLFAWAPAGHYFDYYERTLLNHVMAQQHPRTGMYTYMTPTISGGVREYSTPTDSFWCCVGTGMERHAQFADSIFWHDDTTLYVNLYIPSTMDAAEPDMGIELESSWPKHGNVRLHMTRVGSAAPPQLALRIPTWAADDWSLAVNGEAVTATVEHGYVVLERDWQVGDVVALDLPQRLRLESVAGAPDTVAVFRGPLLMAADLGPSSADFHGPAPALVADDAPLEHFEPVGEARYRTRIAQPEALTFVPFYSQYDRRSAIYFKQLSQAGWRKAEAAHQAQLAQREAIDEAAIDQLVFGDSASEQTHDLTSKTSFSSIYRHQSCRDVRAGGYIEFDMDNAPEQSLVLRLRTWGGDHGGYRIQIDGALVLEGPLGGGRTLAFIEHEKPLPTSSQSKRRVRIESKPGDTGGPFFMMWLLPAEALSDGNETV